MLGIIGAMDVEVNQIKSELQNIEITKKANMEFYKGTLDGKDVVIVRSGIGKVNAGICTQILCDLFDVSAIINTGIAGSLNDDINIGDIVLSEDTLQHDVDAVAFGYDVGVIPQMVESIFKGDSYLIDLAKSACDSVCSDINYFTGRVVSGDQFISDKSKKEWLVNTFKGYCTEMEGAAIAQAAYLNNIPFLIVRSISDKADDSAHMDYPTFEAMAVANSVKLIKEIVKNYESNS